VLKYKLIDELFSVGGNHDLEKSRLVEAKLLEYLNTYGDDAQICDALSILEISANESEKNDLDLSRELAESIFIRLSRADVWDFYDIKILATVVGYAETYQQMCKLIDKALKKLEEHRHEAKYGSTKLCIYMNALHRLSRAKFFDIEDLNDTKWLKKLEKVFVSYFDAIMAICEGDDFALHKTIAEVRKGIFFEKYEPVKEGLTSLTKAGHVEICRMLDDEFQEFSYFSTFRMNKKQYNAIVGANVKEERKARKIPVAVFAEMLGVTPYIIHMVEAGYRSVDVIRIRKIAKALNVCVDTLFVGIDRSVVIRAKSEKKLMMDKIEVMLKKLPNEDIAHLVRMTESLLESREQH